MIYHRAAVTRIRVFVADDHPVFREGLVRAVGSRAEMELAGEATDGRATLDAIRLDPPPQVADDAVIAGLAFLVQSKAGSWVEMHREPAAKLASEAEVDDLLARGLSIFLMKHPSWPK